MGFRLNKNDFVEIQISKDEDKAVKRAVASLKSDLRKVLDCLIEQPSQLQGKRIIVKTEKAGFKNKEEYRVEVINNDLVITGADRRGTIYGIYWFSENVLGVSPWYFFADVPVKQKLFVELADGFCHSDYPIVEYRGIFINDEEELEHFVQRYMGEETIGVKTYEKIFELLLRLGLNYLWPAMHVNSFNLKKENGLLADSMGIVIGTSHCDMLMRSNNREWKPWLAKKGYTDVEYDFSIPGRNREILEEYWRESVQQNKDFDVTWTLGMRGIHDSGFEVRSLEGLKGEELLKAKIKLLEDVMTTQQKILDEEIPKNKEIQKNFVPYKEVLELYDNGLNVPEDMTLIWVNDNYGNVRRYPSTEAKKRVGGHGLYYHNSYWAPPGASYLFLNSIPMAKTRNELRKAYNEGIQKLWVTNFGAIKPLEQQLSFYAKVAWEGAGIKENASTLDESSWVYSWLTRTFPNLENYGDVKKLAEALVLFDQLSDVRKVEFYDNNVIPLEIALNRLKELKAITDLATAFYEKLEEEYKAAFYELVLMRLEATTYTAGMYYFADLSANANTDKEAAADTIKSRKYDVARRELLYYYNHVMMSGKWNGILTPEDFPPPRTALFPATCSIAVNKKKESIKANPVILEAHDAKLTGDWHIVKNLGWGYGDLIEADGEKGEVEFKCNFKGDGVLVLHRYPSLNSVGKIRAGVSIDGSTWTTLETESNDEHRGNWKENILNGVEILTLEINTKNLESIKLKAIDKYFAFSRIAIYTKEDFDKLSEADLRWPSIDAFMKHATTKTDISVRPEASKLIDYIEPRPELYFPIETKTDTLCLEDKFVYLDKSDKDFSFDEAETVRKAREIYDLKAFNEVNHEIYIPAGASAIKEGWDFCNGQGEQGNSLCLLVRDSKKIFIENDAPVAKYSFIAEGGEYDLWAKTYVWSNQEQDFEIMVDENSKVISPKKGYECPWKYSSEHVWKWIHIMHIELEKGEHTLIFKAKHGGLRIEAFKFM